MLVGIRATNSVGEDQFNHRRLIEPIGNIPPAEAEEQYYATLDELAVAA